MRRTGSTKEEGFSYGRHDAGLISADASCDCLVKDPILILRCDPEDGDARRHRRCPTVVNSGRTRNQASDASSHSLHDR